MTFQSQKANISLLDKSIITTSMFCLIEPGINKLKQVILESVISMRVATIANNEGDPILCHLRKYAQWQYQQKKT